jgi:Rad3-related DNA helicase
MWTKQGIINTRNGLTYFGGKRFFREGRDARQNRDIVMTYKKAAVSGGAVLLCVFRGRNSEGSNFPGEQARGIFLVGVPYANYGNPLVKAQIQYFDRAKRGLGNKWYTMDAFRAANQSLGRGIRGKDDWCHYFLFDRRYYGQRNLISKWAKGDGIKRRTSQERKQASFKKFSDDTIIEL